MFLNKQTIISAALIFGFAAAATAGQAGTPQLSDTQFIAANRCLALEDSKSLGPVNDAALRTLIKQEGRQRVGDVLDRADQARDDAASQASRASNFSRAQLVAERDGLCQGLVAPTQTAASGAMSRAVN